MHVIESQKFLQLVAEHGGPSQVSRIANMQRSTINNLMGGCSKTAPVMKIAKKKTVDQLAASGLPVHEIIVTDQNFADCNSQKDVDRVFFEVFGRPNRLCDSWELEIRCNGQIQQMIVVKTFPKLELLAGHSPSLFSSKQIELLVWSTQDGSAIGLLNFSGQLGQVTGRIGSTFLELQGSLANLGPIELDGIRRCSSFFSSR